MLKYQRERSQYCLHCLQRIEERTMNQNGESGIRKGTREKKRSRYHYYDDVDYNAVPGQKNYEQKQTPASTKEKPPTSLEMSVIAKLFCKFINTSNLRCLDLNEAQQSQLVAQVPEFSKEGDSVGPTVNKKNEARSARDVANDSKNQRSRELGQLTNKDQRGSVKEPKNRPPKNGKMGNNLTSSLETDLNYHNALNEHLKNTYPNINAISPDMLRELSIPTDVLQRQQASKPKLKEDKKVGKLGKEENKPFKRQSYHIAIAYHIHLKQVKSSKPQEFLDPTYAARKLREQTHKQREGG